MNNFQNLDRKTQEHTNTMHAPWDRVEAELQRVTGLADVAHLCEVGEATQLKIRFPQVEVHTGAALPLAQVKKDVAFDILGAREGRAYCVYCYDPDPPLWLNDIPHLFVWNLDTPAGSTHIKGDAATHIVPWLAPNPPYGTHRYIFLLCEQRAGHTTPPPAPKRFKTDSAAFLEEHDLHVVSATYFTAGKSSRCSVM